jgi:hypothetical protein
MKAVPTNYLAVVVAALANYIIGAIWYSALFRKSWTRLMGMSEMKVTAPSVILGLVGALLMSYILHHALFFADTYLGTSGIGGGLMVGALNWLGFIAPVTIGVVTYEKKPFSLWLINNGYWLLSLLVMGVILAVWT